MTAVGQDTLGTRATMEVGGRTIAYYSLAKAAEKLGDISRLPFSMKVLLENMLRFEDGGFTVSTADAQAIVDWQKNPSSDAEIQYRPARVLLQDFTGVPCVVDLAAMRDAIAKLGGDTSKINPLVPCDLVIDHSVQVDQFASVDALAHNVEREFERNQERYGFLRWGQQAFDNFRVIPPATGIVHQVNLEYLASVVMVDDGVAFPDSLIGTDSHTTMINGLGVAGWGVGGFRSVDSVEAFLFLGGVSSFFFFSAGAGLRGGMEGFIPDRRSFWIA
jgi:aconitate hydratase